MSIEAAQTFAHEADFPIKEKQLQNYLDKYQYHLKERKHRQFVRDLADFKENRIYSSIAHNGETGAVQTDLSSTETDYSDSDSLPKGNRQSPRGGSRNGEGVIGGVDEEAHVEGIAVF